MSMNVFVKSELRDNDILIEFKPPADLDMDEIHLPARKTTIFNEISAKDIGMEIKIDDTARGRLFRSCYVALNCLADFNNVEISSSNQRKVCRKAESQQIKAISHTTTKPFSCDFRPKTFALKPCLNTHAYKEKTIQCDECPKKFITISYLNKHFRAVHSKPFVCDECPMKFQLESTLKKTERNPFILLHKDQDIRVLYVHS